jgi:sulfopyruvate decarboxylase subunit alpha
MSTKDVLDALVAGNWTVITSVPDKGLDPLLRALDSDRRFTSVPSTREEEAIGICAGAAFAGRRGVLLTQNSGIGNSVNALLSLIHFYDLPLLLLISQRGGSGERIAAQMPMGRATRPLLEACDIPVIAEPDRTAFIAAIAKPATERLAIVATPEQWIQLLGSEA